MVSTTHGLSAKVALVYPTRSKASLARSAEKKEARYLDIRGDVFGKRLCGFHALITTVRSGSLAAIVSVATDRAAETSPRSFSGSGATSTCVECLPRHNGEHQSRLCDTA
jgi:hypothetical protein